jgi:hypothetical protein
MNPWTQSLTWSWVFLIFLAYSPAGTEEWSRAYISHLPDSAFAVIEKSPDGKTVRHLPHHDHTGALDVPHLRSALGRLKQVKWLDPTHETEARSHLEQHRREYKEERSAKGNIHTH